ncbi:MAG: septum formation initiator family protein [Patescibacteria group bacterium]|nr:septum formation initiator family protein [Patescibacteria group bacterium]
MYHHQTQSKFVSFFYSGKFILLALLLALFIGLAFFQENRRQGKINSRLNELRLEAQKLETSNLELARLLSYSESKDYLELQARQNLNYKKEGEGVIIINRDENSKNQTLKDTRPNWQKWVEYVFTRE